MFVQQTNILFIFLFLNLILSSSSKIKVPKNVAINTERGSSSVQTLKELTSSTNPTPLSNDAPAKNSPTYVTRMVHVITRHGQRMPRYKLPNDDGSVWKSNIGEGELTLKGSSDMTALGNELRKKYIDQIHLIHPTYQKQDLYVRSSDVDRCLMSAQSLLRGLYPKGEPLPPVHTVPQSEEYLLRGYDHCHRYHQFVQSKLNSEEVRVSLLGDLPLFHKMSRLTGVDVSIKNLKPVTDTILVIEELSKELSKANKIPYQNGKGFKNIKSNVTTTLTDNDMQRIAALHDQMNYIMKSNRPMSRLMVGNLLRSMLSSVAQYISGSKKSLDHSVSVPKVMVYSGHDTTVMGLLTAFGAVNKFGKKTPPTASHIEFELLELAIKSTSESGEIVGANDFYIRVAYNGEVIRLGGACASKDVCAISKVAEYLSTVVPSPLVSWSLECANTRQDIGGQSSSKQHNGNNGDNIMNTQQQDVSEEEQLFENGYMGLDWDEWSSMAIFLSFILVMINVMFDQIVIQYLFEKSQFLGIQAESSRRSPKKFGTPYRSHGNSYMEEEDASLCCCGVTRRSIICGIASALTIVLSFIFLIAFGIDWIEWPKVCFVLVTFITFEATIIVGVTIYTKCLKPMDEYGTYGRVATDDYNEDWGNDDEMSDTL